MIVGAAATDVSQNLSRYPEEAVTSTEVNGQSVSIVVESDKCLDAFMQYLSQGKLLY